MEKMPHIQLDQSIQATAAILPGDPGRVDVIASFMEDVKEEGFHREYKSITGTYKGRRILVISTGMGGGSTAICVEELADLGVTELIRIGSCGALQKHLRLGELVVCEKAICDDGASQSYLNYFLYADPQFNQQYGDAREKGKICYSYADPELTERCLKACKKLGFDSEPGVARSHDALYLKSKGALDEFYSERGAFASDMETAALFAVGSVRKVRTSSILNVVVEWKKDVREGVGAYAGGEDKAAEGERNEILAALEALAMTE